MIKKVKKIILKISEKSVIARKVIRSASDIYRKIKYKIATVGIKVDDKTIMFCVFDGRSYTCSPKAIYEYMLKSRSYEDHKMIWAFKDVEKYRCLESNKNTKIVKINTREYKKSLAN